MFSRTKYDESDERLDEVGEGLVRAARATEGEIDAAADGPLLYSRIRASITARQRDLEGSAGGWLAFVRAARLAVPAMALVTVLVTFVPRLGLIMTRHNMDLPQNARLEFSKPAPPTARILGFAAGACALSNNDECAISNNEVLATLFADDKEETQR